MFLKILLPFAVTLLGHMRSYYGFFAFCFYFFETRFFCVTLAVLELAL